MRKPNPIFFVLMPILFFSCVSTRNTIKNIDSKAILPRITPENTFAISEFSKDPKYGYDKDYPINVFYGTVKLEDVNQNRFLNALTGPNGEVLKYTKTGICCPFPSKNTNTGGGFLEVYQITYEGQKTSIRLYLNKYEKGALQVPMGLGLKK